jgi:hypothetical protein
MTGTSVYICRTKSIFGLPLIPPDSSFVFAWTAFMLLVDLTYTAFWVPIDVAFCSLNYGDISGTCTRVEFAGGWFVFFPRKHLEMTGIDSMIFLAYPSYGQASSTCSTCSCRSKLVLFSLTGFSSACAWMARSWQYLI